MFEKVLNFLENEKKVEILQKFEHKITKTSKESAEVRGVDVRLGAKAILLSIKKSKLSDNEFIIVVVCGDDQIDSKVIKKYLKIKSIRFANEDELKNNCENLIKGSLPPFGNLFGLKTYIDEDVMTNSKIYFNAGSLTNSVSISIESYKKCLEDYTVFSFSKKKKKIDV